MKTSDWQANPRNPRTISDPQLAALKAAMIEFGDLSGLIVNRTTLHTIGGHQRIKILGDLPVTINQRFDPPTKRGTVAEGFVEYNGERFVYREVVWTPTQEKAAMIAANKHGGDFETDMLADLLRELKDDDEFAMDLTGFSERELNRLLAKDDEPTIKGLENLEIVNEIRLVQLQLTTETLPIFLERVRQLGEQFGLADNITETVYRAVEKCHANFCASIQPDRIQPSGNNGDPIPAAAPVDPAFRDPAFEHQTGSGADPSGI